MDRLHLHLVPQAADEPADPLPAAGSPEVAGRPPDGFGILPVSQRQVVALGLLRIERTRRTRTPAGIRNSPGGSPPPLKAVGDVDDAGRRDTRLFGRDLAHDLRPLRPRIILAGALPAPDLL